MGGIDVSRRPESQLSKRLSKQLPRIRTHGVLLSVAGIVLLLVLYSIVSWSQPRNLFLVSFGLLSPRSGVFISFVLAAGRIHEAQDRVADEREAVAAEREAFLDFAERVGSISTGPGQSPGQAACSIVNPGGGSSSIQEVKEQYRKTILTLPDHEDAYDESLEEHLAAEFGGEIASLVFHGQHFDAQVKALLVQQAQESARDRQQLLEIIDTEAQSLQSASSQLEPVANYLGAHGEDSVQTTSFDDALKLATSISRYRNDCEQVIETRQQEVHSIDSRTGGRTDEFFQEYLYNSFSVSFPVLTTALAYIRSLDSQWSTLVSELTRPA